MKRALTEAQRAERQGRKKGESYRFKIRDRNGAFWIRCADGRWVQWDSPAVPRKLTDLSRAMRSSRTMDRPRFVSGDYFRIDRKAQPVSLAYGVELEGAWTGHDIPENMKGDGSVHFPNLDTYDYCNCEDCRERRGSYDADDTPEESHRWVVGEVADGPFDSIAEALDWTRRVYPKRVNATCGMHVHISGVDWQKISDQSARLFIKGARKLPLASTVTRQRLESRLAGANRYCKPGVGYNDRYYQINTTSYHRHGTVEVRVWPMATRYRDAARMLNYTAQFAQRHWR